MEQRKKGFRPKIPKRAKQGCEQREVKNGAEQRAQKHIDPQLPAADAQREEKAERGEGNAVEHIERLGKQAQPLSPHADRAQQIVQECGGNPQQQGVKERGDLRGKRHAHCLPSEQTGKQTAAPVAEIFIADRVDTPVHVKLSAVKTQLADVQIFSLYDECSGGGGHDDFAFIEAVNVLHTGDGELFPSVKLKAMRSGRNIIGHRQPSFRNQKTRLPYRLLYKSI